MYAFELAAEFKARSERNLVLVTTASVRSIYHISVTSYKLLCDVIVKTFQEKNQNANNRRYRRNGRPTNLDSLENPEDYSNFDDDDHPRPLRRGTSVAPNHHSNTNPQSSKRTQQQQTTTDTVAGLDADEQTLNDFLSFLAARKAAEGGAAVTTTPPASALATTSSTTNALPKSTKGSSAIPSAPYLPGFLGPDGQLIPPTQPTTTTRLAASTAPLQRAQPPPPKTTTSSGIDLSELKNRPLRKVGGVNAPNDQTTTPAKPKSDGGIDLSELQRRPLRKVNKDDSQGGNSNDGGIAAGSTFGRANLKPVQPNKPSPPQPEKQELVLRGKRVESSSIPGEENMSFSDRIKVASKMTLKQTHAPRSPGGTPRREKKQPENEFVAALRHKFRNVNRDSLNEGPDESETEWN